jgi:YD repeat-containing protein
MDPLNGDRLTAQTDGLGNTTKYGCDTDGFQDSVIDPNGNVTFTGHDIRGNVTSQTTCQSQPESQELAGLCSTAYFSYYPDDTSATLTPDPRNDLPLTERAPGSASSTDTAFLTSYAYNAQGELTSETGPSVPQAPAGQSVGDELAVQVQVFLLGAAAAGGIGARGEHSVMPVSVIDGRGRADRIGRAAGVELPLQPAVRPDVQDRDEPAGRGAGLGADLVGGGAGQDLAGTGRAGPG